MKIFLDK